MIIPLLGWLGSARRLRAASRGKSISALRTIPAVEVIEDYGWHCVSLIFGILIPLDVIWFRLASRVSWYIRDRVILHDTHFYLPRVSWYLRVSDSFFSLCHGWSLSFPFSSGLMLSQNQWRLTPPCGSLNVILFPPHCWFTERPPLVAVYNDYSGVAVMRKQRAVFRGIPT